MTSSRSLAGSSEAGDPARVELKINSRCSLGEAATWCARSGRLFWADIDGAVLWIYDSRKAWSTSLQMPERLACLALCKDPRYLLLGLETRLALFDMIAGSITSLVEVEPDLPTRLNDGRCDRQGRFVFGTKHDVDCPEAIGGFYRLNRDLSLERLPLPACAIANGIAFSPDGLAMYYCDSPSREIRICDYPSCRNDRLFIRLGREEGVPDGAAVDSEGGLWSARWGGSCVVRHAPDGRETKRIHLPVTQPTCVAFGGLALNTLYVTSAHCGLDEDDASRSAGAGGVFVAEPGISGIAEPLFEFHKDAAGK
ncbi:SMP-30/gluconolactonase/LRE family protein [Paraburkholderia sp. B3]|uniref:SMP-30/gluconolactonase/LRE family protein n=1 Tax=Paraburkholderia sp. B3 TaxID=3134791 RepID=UPI0039821462